MNSLRYALAAGVVALIVALGVARPLSLLGLLAVALGVWLIGGSLTDILRRAGGLRRLRFLPATAFPAALAHAGLGVVALGVAGASIWKSEAIQVVAPHQTMNVGGYTLRLEGTERVQGPNYFADRATVTVLQGGQTITVLHPEKRNYPVEQMATTESSIRTTGVSDLYVVLGDPRDGGGWVMRAYYNPMAPFIWLGGVIMALAGFTALGARVAARFRARRQATNMAAEPAE